MPDTLTPDAVPATTNPPTQMMVFKANCVRGHATAIVIPAWEFMLTCNVCHKPLQSMQFAGIVGSDVWERFKSVDGLDNILAGIGLRLPKEPTHAG